MTALLRWKHLCLVHCDTSSSTSFSTTTACHSSFSTCTSSSCYPTPNIHAQVCQFSGDILSVPANYFPVLPLVCLIANIQEFTVYNPELFLSSFKSTEYSYCALVCVLPWPHSFVAMANMILRFEACNLTFILSSLSLPPNLNPGANTAIT